MATKVHQNLLAGEWRESGHSSININPSDISDIVGEYSIADSSQVQAAIDGAQAAFREWSAVTPQQRFDTLDRVATELFARKDELGTLLAREEGKTLPEAIGEVARAAYIFKYFAGESLRSEGELVQSVRPGVSVEVTREPVGVVGIITPWNFPIAIPAWKIAAAMAHGNCVVFKPSELVPGCGWALSEIIARSGAPKGTLNLVMGDGHSVGELLVGDARVDAVSFTGSAATGRKVAASCLSRMAKVQLEMGGKNPQVILDDADLKTAVDICVQSAFFSTGQRCTAASRLIVTEGIYQRFLDALTERTMSLRVDHALTKDTDIGPVASAAQLERNLSYIEIGKQEGAMLLTGGKTLKRKTNGHYLSPALFTETAPHMRINREEIFGPVASVIRVKNYDEALTVANDTPFGLSSGIATTSLKHAIHFKRHSQSGMVMVNLPTAGVDYHVPFGGRKASSYGPREQGSHAREFYTQVKTAYISA
jgi:acyl-CoA reductase-like NAD-dependent aldehyde dehydrogenase